MDKYADMTLAQLEALAAETKAKFDAIKALPAPTAGQIEEANVHLQEAKAIKAAIAKFSSTFGSEADEVFAPKKEEEAEVSEPETEVRKEAGEEPEHRTIAPSAEINEADQVGGSGTVQHKETIEESPGQVVEPGQEAPAEGGGTESASGTVAQLAARTGRPAKADTRRRPGSAPVLIRASAGVDPFSPGQRLTDLAQVTEGVISRAGSIPAFTPAEPEVAAQGIKLQKLPTASFGIDFPDELMLNGWDASHSEVDAALKAATDESTLQGGSLTAAGGWCAPSETVYDLTQDSTAEGMVSLPEVGVRRGGLRWPVSPTFEEFYANPGFFYTEAQVIAGVTKPCVTVDCPDFSEKRMDVEGLCIKVDILTNVGYPEYVRNFVDGTLVAHQHWINANVIGQLVTAAGAARVITGLGATMTDTLEGLELLANQRRQQWRLSMNRTMEVVVPFWVKDMVKADLRRRFGQMQPVTDQQVQQHFSTAKLNVQFVYDWQPLDLTAEVYPGTFNALMYPAGTFVKGTQPVISLSTVYDAASLQANTYTGLFTEQGFMVMSRKFAADLVTLPVCNAGRVGAADLTCVVAP